MKVTLIDKNSLLTAIMAMRMCWRTGDKIDSYYDDKNELVVGKKDKSLVKRIVGFDHTSTVEHHNFSFLIEGVSRALLQELARHRMASMSVESSRYCLKRLLKDEIKVDSLTVSSGNMHVDAHVKRCVESLIDLMVEHPEITNDKLKYGMVEAFQTNLIWTINVRSLRNFLKLRTAKGALAEIRALSWYVYNLIPEDSRFLFEDIVED